ncbi:MAG: ankyrin repeat domain-containing protein [Desulfobacterales bacterium]
MRIFYGLAAISLGWLLCSCGGLLYNAQIGNVGRMDKALSSGVSIETKNEAGSTALIIATYSKQPEAVEYLCKKGADVNARNSNGATALHLAAFYDLPAIAEILLTYRPDKTLKDKYGNTPLDYARQYQYARMISLLEK